MAFTADQAVGLTGVSRAQLSAWDREGFFIPAHANPDRRLRYSRIYSFRDLACLRVLGRLRNDFGVPLSELREVKNKLAHLGDDLWASTTLYVLGRRVVFEDPQTGTREEVTTGQKVVPVPLRVVTANLQDQVDRLWQRNDDKIGHIERIRGVSGGGAIVSGTRVTVRALKSFAAAGYGEEEILQEYPTLTPQDVRAALAYDEAA